MAYLPCASDRLKTSKYPILPLSYLGRGRCRNRRFRVSTDAPAIRISEGKRDLRERQLSFIKLIIPDNPALPAYRALRSHAQTTIDIGVLSSRTRGRAETAPKTWSCPDAEGLRRPATRRSDRQGAETLRRSRPAASRMLPARDRASNRGRQGRAGRWYPESSAGTRWSPPDGIAPRAGPRLPRALKIQSPLPKYRPCAAFHRFWRSILQT